MKVRSSNGLQVAEYFGNFLHHTFGADLEIGVIDADKAIGVKFSYDGKLDSKRDAHFQSALLYTTASGQRRVRCSNIIASVSDNARECMKFVDQDAIYTLIAKDAASRLATTSTSLKDIRLGLTEKTIDVLAGYRKNFSAQNHPPGQLVMPERLKEFAMYMLALIKSRAFKGGSESTDRRVHDMRMVRAMGAGELSVYLYPRMIPIHNLQPEDGFPDETGHLRMPPTIRTSFSRVEPGGVYLVDNGQVCLLWLHAQTSPNLLADLFGEGLDSLANLDPYASSLPLLDTHLNAQARNILEFLRTVRGSKALTLQLARQGMDGAEFEFARMLVEDRNNEAQSYVDWLVHVHKGVQLEVSTQIPFHFISKREVLFSLSPAPFHFWRELVANERLSSCSWLDSGRTTREAPWRRALRGLDPSTGNHCVFQVTRVPALCFPGQVYMPREVRISSLLNHGVQVGRLVLNEVGGSY